LEGPLSISGGEEGNWQILITNKNKTNLELADLVIDYPDGSRVISIPINNSKTISERRSIGQIKAGETVTETISAYLFGEKDTDKIFKLTLEYRPSGSNAILAKTAEQTVRLLQSPVEVSVSLPSESNAGEEITLEISIISNTQTVIKDMNLKIDYPAGFEYRRSDLKPVFGDNVWHLGDLESNKERKIKITGILEGQDLTELTFRASAGPLDAKGEIIAYGFSSQSIILKKPFLKLNAVINDRAGETIASPGANLNITIDWQNTLPVKINNAVIEVKLSGSAVDQRSIELSNGFYRSFDKTLVWNQSSSPDLAAIEPLSEGEARFRFSILNPLLAEVISKGNPVISLEVQMRGERITEDQGSVQVTNHLTKEIKIATVFQLSRRALYYSGAFKNTGPLPPKVGKETAYTIVWSISNSSNTVSDVTVSAFLPSYVRWLGVVKPENADVSYNQTTGEIAWKAGTVPPGTGILTSGLELDFQISFLPNLSQAGSQPVLISETTVGGKDVFTGAYLRDVKSALTTYLDTDPQFKYNEGFVTQ
jgi:hypothetical protein